jgi:hypothetical protein
MEIIPIRKYNSYSLNEAKANDDKNKISRNIAGKRKVLVPLVNSIVLIQSFFSVCFG